MTDYNDDDEAPTQPHGWVFYKAGDGTYLVGIALNSGYSDEAIEKARQCCEYKNRHGAKCLTS